MLEDLLTFIQKEENVAERFAEDTKKWLAQDGQNRVYLYGGGFLMQFYLRFLRTREIPVSGILDTYKEGMYQDVPVICLDTFLQASPDLKHCRLVISSAAYARDIMSQLSITFPRENLFFFDPSYIGFEDMSLAEYRSYLVAHWDEIVELYENLADDRSKDTLICVLKGHISGDASWYFETLDPNLDYPRDIVQFADDEVLVEAGASNGNTFLEFVRRCPGYRTAYLFEPEECFQERLHEIATAEAEKGKEVHVIQKGLWDEATTLQFVSTEEGSGTFVMSREAGNMVTVVTATVDSAVQEPFTHLKMDVEGAELRVLQGAQNHISAHRPRLGISVYHKPTDLLDVWQYVRAIRPDYKFYLRNHTPIWDDVILYAI